MPDIEEKVYAGLNALTRFKSNLARLECIASNEDLIGHDVTATQGTLSVTETIGDDGKCILRLPKIGTWQITEDLYSTVQSFTLPYYGEYSTMVGGDVFITVLYSEEFNYSTLTLTDGQGHSYSRLVDATGSVQFVVAQYGTWTVSGVVEGETYTASVTAPTAGEYTINLTASTGGFDYERWLTAGGVVGTYSSLDEVLADEKALRQLFTKHASVDYLVDTCETELDENVEKIIKTDLCAKWINLRDYALDTLYANEFIADAMDHSGVIDMGETGLVPVMTSNTAPYGVASSPDEGGLSSFPTWKAFDGDADTNNDVWIRTSTTSYIQYQFINPIKVSRVSWQVVATNDTSGATGLNATPKLQGSNDGVTFTDIGTMNMIAENAKTIVYADVNTDEYYKYLRVQFNGNNYIQGGVNVYCGFSFLQFYGSIDYGTKYFLGEWALTEQVPVLSSNIGYNGTAISDSNYSIDQSAWKAFDRGIAEYSYWLSTSANNGWIGYHFNKPTTIYSVVFNIGYNRDFTYKIQTKNDVDTEWTDLTSLKSDNGNHVITENIGGVTNTNFRLFIGTMAESITCTELNFIGYSPKGNVPIMTSNSAPYGTANAYHNNTAAYSAFDGNASTAYSSLGNMDTNDFVSYKFPNPVCVKMFRLLPQNATDLREYSIQASNDGNTWNTLYSGDASTTSEIFQNITNDDFYLYYRIKSETNLYGYYFGCRTLQFYGRELKASVPKMTSDTSPWGEAIADGADAYKAFDKIYTSSELSWGCPTPNLTKSAYCGYNWKNNILLKTVRVFAICNGNIDITYKVQGSNDGSVWDDISEEKTLHATGNVQEIDFTTNSNIAYSYHRISMYSNSYLGIQAQYSCYFVEIDFYGLDYSEHQEGYEAIGAWSEEISDFADRFAFFTDGNVNGSQNGDYSVVISSPLYDNCTFSMSLKTPIDVTEYSKLNVIANAHVGDTTGRALCVGLSNTKATGAYSFDNISEYESGVQIALNNTTPSQYTLSLDISSLNGEKYVSLGGQYVRGIVQRLWLE